MSDFNSDFKKRENSLTFLGIFFITQIILFFIEISKIEYASFLNQVTSIMTKFEIRLFCFSFGTA